jgi:hypothetical protein
MEVVHPAGIDIALFRSMEKPVAPRQTSNWLAASTVRSQVGTMPAGDTGFISLSSPTGLEVLVRTTDVDRILAGSDLPAKVYTTVTRSQRLVRNRHRTAEVVCEIYRHCRGTFSEFTAADVGISNNDTKMASQAGYIARVRRTTDASVWILTARGTRLGRELCGGDR